MLAEQHGRGEHVIDHDARPAGARHAAELAGLADPQSGRLDGVAGIVICSSPSAVVPAGADEMSALRSREPECGLVPAPGLDELLGGAAAVGVGVGHSAAQLCDGRCVRRGLSGSLAVRAVQVVFGGLAGGEEEPARPGRWPGTGITPAG